MRTAPSISIIYLNDILFIVRCYNPRVRLGSQRFFQTTACSVWPVDTTASVSINSVELIATSQQCLTKIVLGNVTTQILG